MMYGIISITDMYRQYSDMYEVRTFQDVLICTSILYYMLLTFILLSTTAEALLCKEEENTERHSRSPQIKKEVHLEYWRSDKGDLLHRRKQCPLDAPASKGGVHKIHSIFSPLCSALDRLWHSRVHPNPNMTTAKRRNGRCRVPS